MKNVRPIKIIPALALWLLSFLASVQVFGARGSSSISSISKDAQFSLITCGPGADLYSVFGHSAIRLKDTITDTDIVFNYGTFDFGPDFYMKFARGKLNYRMSVSSFEGFMRSYASEQRWVKEQVLNLSQKDEEVLYAFLEHNYLPQNRYYLYDFFYNNCSSKLRDILADNFPNRVEFAHTYKEGEPSFRELFTPYVKNMPWGDFGVQIGLGLPADNTAKPTEYMYLPVELMDAFDEASIKHHEQFLPLVLITKTLLDLPNPEPDYSIWTHPYTVFGLCFLLAVLLTIREIRRKKSPWLFDVLWFTAIGLTGILIVFLWFFTDHNTTQNNLNILWAFPLSIPFFYFYYLFSLKLKKVWLVLMGGSALIFLIQYPFSPQGFHAAVLLIAMTNLTRAVGLWKQLNNKL